MNMISTDLNYRLQKRAVSTIRTLIWLMSHQEVYETASESKSKTPASKQDNHSQENVPTMLDQDYERGL